MKNSVEYVIGFFLFPFMPEYCVHYIPETTLKVNRSTNDSRNMNHFRQANNTNNTKSKIKIRNFNRNSKVNYF